MCYESTVTHRGGLCCSLKSSCTGHTMGRLKMDYNKRLERLDRHIAEHPKDYQAVIGRLKCYSDAVEHQIYLRKIERLKRVAEFRRKRNEQE